MTHQLTIFEALGDTDYVSPDKSLGDTKFKALERFCNRSKIDPKPLVKRYKPNNRRTEYYRLDYTIEKKPKSIHIKGGNCRARLARYRAKFLQDMINRGASLPEVLEALADFNGGRTNRQTM